MLCNRFRSNISPRNGISASSSLTTRRMGRSSGAHDPKTAAAPANRICLDLAESRVPRTAARRRRRSEAHFKLNVQKTAASPANRMFLGRAQSPVLRTAAAGLLMGTKRRGNESAARTLAHTPATHALNMPRMAGSRVRRTAAAGPMLNVTRRGSVSAARSLAHTPATQALDMPGLALTLTPLLNATTIRRGSVSAG